MTLRFSGGLWLPAGLYLGSRYREAKYRPAALWYQRWLLTDQASGCCEASIADSFVVDRRLIVLPNRDKQDSVHVTKWDIRPGVACDPIARKLPDNAIGTWRFFGGGWHPQVFLQTMSFTNECCQVLRHESEKSHNIAADFT